MTSLFAPPPPPRATRRIPGAAFAAALLGAALAPAASLSVAAQTETPPNLAPPDKPTNVAATGQPGSILLTWTVPDSRPSIENFEVSTDGANWVIAPGNPGPPQADSYIFTGLTNCTSYTVYVRARAVNGVASGSVSARATPLDDDVEKPTNLSVTAGDGLADLSWSLPGNAKDACIDKWEYTYNNGVTWATIGTTASLTSYRAGGLTNGVEHEFRVRASNARATGLPSDLVKATPLAPRPQAPIMQDPTPGNKQVTVNWTLTPGEVTGYDISQDNGSTWTAITGDRSTLSHTVTGLTNGTAYTFRVRSKNTGGTSDMSAGARAVPYDSSQVPVAPYLVADGGDTTVQLIWTKPSGTVTGYDYSQDDGSTWTAVPGNNGSGRTHVVTGLTNGTTYTFKVRGKNANGNGAASNAATARPFRPQNAPGAPTNLSAAAGDGQVTLTWALPAGTITSWDYAQDGTWKAMPGSSKTTSRYVVTGLTNFTDYTFKVRARNSVGAGGESNAVTARPVIALPGAPTLTGTRRSGAVDLTWTAPTTGGAVASYVYTRDGGTTWPVASNSPSTRWYTVSGLTNGVEYTFQVAGKNSAGVGLYSNAVRVTPALVAPGAPKNLRAYPLDGEVQLAWLPPGGDVTGHDYSTDDGASWSDMPGAGKGTDLFTVTGLTNGTEYTFRVRAKNTAGAGAQSNAATATPLGTPGKPTLTAAPADKKVTLSWTVPTSGGAVETWRYSKDNGSTWTVMTGSSSTTRSYVVSGLTNGTEYTFKVRGWNATASGPESNAAKATPNNIRVTVSTARIIAGGSSQNEHWVTFSHALPHPITLTPVVAAAATNPAEGDEYVTPTQTLTFFGPGSTKLSKQYHVTTAVNDDADNDVDRYTLSFTMTPSFPITAGTGELLEPAQWEMYTKSGKLTVDEGSSIVLRARIKGEITWDAVGAFIPAHGTAEDGDWTMSRIDSVECPLGVDPLCTRTGNPEPTLTANEDDDADDETVVVSLRIRTGSSGFGELLLPPVPLTITIRDNDSPGPGAPTGLTATPGNAEVDLAWTAPTGRTITSYDYSTDDGATWTAMPGSGATTTTYTVTGLTNGAVYTFRVRAKNNDGTGAPSDQARAMPQLPRPGKPGTLSAVASGTQVRLTWSTGAGTITGYDYRFWISGKDREDARYGSGWLDISGSSATTTAHVVQSTVTGPGSGLRKLDPGKNYTFQVRPENGSGVGGESNEASATLAPAAPTGLTATAGDAHVTLAWTAPSGTVTSYEYSQDGGNWTAIDGGSVTSVVVSKLTNGTEYAFKVRAKNSGGAGPASNEAKATPQAAQTAPGAPTNLTATPGDTRVTLKWTAPSGAITSYDYSQDNGANWKAMSGSGASTTSHVVEGLTNGTEYTFKVRARNTVGAGAASNAAKATPKAALTAPGAPTNLTAVGGDTIVTLSWTAPSGAITSYDYSQDNGGNWTAMSGSGASTTSHVVRGLTNDTEYTFKVRARNTAGAGAASNAAKATPRGSQSGGGAPGAPTNLTATAGNGQVTLQWLPPSDKNVTGYDYSQDGGTWTSMSDIGEEPAAFAAFAATTNTPPTTHVVTGLTNGTKYTYQVRAKNGYGASGPSNSASATPNAPCNNGLAGPDADGVRSVTCPNPGDDDDNDNDDNDGDDGDDGDDDSGSNRPPTVEVSCDPCRVPPGGNVALTAQASDPDGDPITYAWSAPSGRFAGATDAEAARWTAPDAAGPVTLRVEVADGHGGAASATATIEVGNRPPAFTRSTYDFELPENRDGRQQPFELGHVTAEDPDGTALTYELASGDRARFAIGETDGGVRYIGPGEDYETEPNLFQLSARVRDPHGGVTQAPVVVRVIDGNEPPMPDDDRALTSEDQMKMVDVLTNDADPDGDRLRVESVSAPAHGTTAVTARGVEYMPAENYHGADRFTYVVSDGRGATATAAVEVTVMPMNDAPLPVGTIPHQTFDEGDDAAALRMTEYFEDVDGDELTYRAVVSEPGVAAVTVAGAVLTVAPLAPGAATVTVTAQDPGGLTATQRFAVGVRDKLVRDAVLDLLAGMARSHLASTRMILGRRVTTGGNERSRLSVAGRRIPLGIDEAGDEAEQLLAGWMQQAGWQDPEAPLDLQLQTASSAPPGPGGAPGTTPVDGLDGLGFGDLGGGPRSWLRGLEFLFNLGKGNEAGGNEAGGRKADGQGAGGGDGAPRPGRRWQVWGQGDVQAFQGGRGATSEYDGTLRTGWVGLDTWLSGRWLTGVAVARSDAGGAWSAADGERTANGSLNTTLTAVHPYVQWSDGTISVWASAGGGRGAAEHILQDGRLETSDLGLRQGLAEVRRRLGAPGGPVEVAVRGDAAWARLRTAEGDEAIDDQSAAVHQTRVGVDVTGALKLGRIGLAPFGEVHLRRDGGAGQPGTGVEVVGGVRAAGGVVRVDAQTRMLVVHTADGYRERGAGVTLSVGNQEQDGFSLSVAPSWGNQAGGGALWQDEIIRRHLPQAADDAWAMDARVNYRMPLRRGAAVTWFGAFRGSQHGRGFQVGGRIGLPR